MNDRAKHEHGEAKKHALEEAQAQDKGSDLNVAVATGIADTISAAVWPLVALVAFLVLKGRLHRLLEVFTARLEDKQTNVSLGSLTITAQQGDIETLRASVAQLRTVVDSLAKSSDGGPSTARTATSTNNELEALATAYAQINEGDKRLRVRKKDELGRQMGAVVHLGGLDRASLLAANDDAHFVALAYAVVLEPQQGDTALLVEAGRHARTKHARYAIARALGSLSSASLVTKDQVAAVQEVLNQMETGDLDESLRNRIEQTRASLATQRR